MSAIKQEILDLKLTEVFSNDYVAVFTDATGKILLCQTQASYIPIEVFKASFQRCAELIALQGVERFIFDKRSLRAFHQPSMEWYFVVWKQEIFEKSGMRVHRKILPSEAWFRKSVEAGRSEIEQKHPVNVFSKLDIRYTSNIQEAMLT